jgi:hypothetical protein
MTAPKGERDLDFLKRTFHKLMLNFTWWSVGQYTGVASDVFVFHQLQQCAWPESSLTVFAQPVSIGSIGRMPSDTTSSREAFWVWTTLASLIAARRWSKDVSYMYPIEGFGRLHESGVD